MMLETIPGLNQYFKSNESKVSCSWEQQKSLMGLNAQLTD